jgi:hypothetical protein
MSSLKHLKQVLLLKVAQITSHLGSVVIKQDKKKSEDLATTKQLLEDLELAQAGKALLEFIHT